MTTDFYVFNGRRLRPVHTGSGVLPGQRLWRLHCQLWQGNMLCLDETSTLDFVIASTAINGAAPLRASLSDGTSAGIHESDAEPERKVRGRLRNN